MFVTVAGLKTYLVAEILESKGNELALRHPSDAEVEPCSVVLALHVRRCVAGHPDVETIFEVASLGPS